MAIKKQPVPFDEFASDVAGFFERVVHGHETLLVEKTEGDLVVMKAASRKRPVRTGRRRRPLSNRDDFLSTAGSWKGLVDTDNLVENIYESRSISSRPSIQLLHGRL